MTEIGYASLAVIPSFKGFDNNLERGIAGPMTSTGRTAGQRFSSAFASVAKVGILGALGAGALAIKIGADSIEQASTLNESLNAVTVTYGKQAEAVKQLGTEAAESLGLSNSEFNSLSVRFSAFSKTIAGGDGKAVVSTLDDLTTRASDFASVMNLEVNEAAELFQSGLAGETEPLRKFGIDLSAAAVSAHAVAAGINDGTHEITEAEKVQARYSLLMKQTNKTQGDFANTSGDLANQQRILNAKWDDARAKLGTALLPLMEDLVGFVLDKGIPAFERFSDWFAEDGIHKLEDFGVFLRDEILPPVKDLGGLLLNVAEAGGEVVKFFNNLPGPAKIAALGAVLGGVGAAKLRGGAGALGTAGSALGLAKPVPVFVTNPGFGGVGGAGAPVVAGGTPSKLGKVARGAGKVFLPVTALVVGYELGGKEFGEGADPAGALGIGGDDRLNIKDAAAAVNAVKNEVKVGLGSIIGESTDAVTRITAGFKTLPETLQTRFNLLGIPENEKDLRNLLRVYDLTPKEKTTTLELLGYEPLLGRIARVNRELDWAARPREARINITRAYANAGYQTQGGLLEGGSNENYAGAQRRMGE